MHHRCNLEGLPFVCTRVMPAQCTQLPVRLLGDHNLIDSQVLHLLTEFENEIPRMICPPVLLATSLVVSMLVLQLAGV